MFKKENERLKEMMASKMSAGNGSTEEKRRIIDVTLECQTKLVAYFFVHMSQGS